MRLTKSSEHQDQVALFRWAKARSATLPDLRMLFAIPNGGQRNVIVAQRMKEAGVKPGIPDLFLPVPRDTFHGLWIEMKAGRNMPTADQRLWMNALEDKGFKVCVCRGWEEAANELLKYLGEMEDRWAR